MAKQVRGRTETISGLSHETICWLSRLQKSPAERGKPPRDLELQLKRLRPQTKPERSDDVKIRGLCDVPQCEGKTYVGWRPYTVPQGSGKQICRYHHERHKDESDNFSLFDVFGFLNALTPTPIDEQTVRRCACGEVLLPRHRYCSECSTERERLRQGNRRQKAKTEPIEVSSESLKCRDCGREREAGHIYCDRCAKIRGKKRKRNWAKKKRRPSMTV